ALGDAACRRHAVRAIAVAIDDSDLIAAAKAIPQTVLASRRIALEDLPLGQAVKAHENFLRLELIEDGTGDRGEGVEERRVIVEGRDDLDRGNVPQAGGFAEDLLDRRSPRRRRVLREERKEDEAID